MGDTCFFVPKKDGKLRFCVDYRRLNTMTVKDSYPLPRMDECIDSLGDASVFTTLDAYSGYWQVAINPKTDTSQPSYVILVSSSASGCPSA